MGLIKKGDRMGSFAPTFTKIEHFTHLSSSRNVGAGLAPAQYLILPPPGISYYATARLYPSCRSFIYHYATTRLYPMLPLCLYPTIPTPFTSYYAYTHYFLLPLITISAMLQVGRLATPSFNNATPFGVMDGLTICLL